MRKDNGHKSIHNFKRRGLALLLAVLMLFTTMQLDSQIMTATAEEDVSDAAAKSPTEETTTVTEYAADKSVPENEVKEAEESVGDTIYNEANGSVGEAAAENTANDANPNASTEEAAGEIIYHDEESASGDKAEQKTDEAVTEAPTDTSADNKVKEEKTNASLEETAEDKKTESESEKATRVEKSTEEAETVYKSDEDKAKEEKANEPKMPAGGKNETTASGIRVSVSYDEGVFPKGTEMVVSDVTKKDALAAAKDALEDKDTSVKVKDAVAVDIKFIYEGEEIQPKGKVNVTIDQPKALKEGDEVAVVHVSSDGEATEVKEKDIEEATETKAEFTAEEFSTWVVATYTTQTVVKTVTYSNVNKEGLLDSGDIAAGSADEYTHKRVINNGGGIAAVYSSTQNYRVPDTFTFAYEVPANKEVEAVIELRQSLKPASNLSSGTLMHTNRTKLSPSETTIYIETITFADDYWPVVLQNGETFSVIVTLRTTDASGEITVYGTGSGSGYIRETGSESFSAENGHQMVGVHTNYIENDPSVTIEEVTASDGKKALAVGDTLQLSATLSKDVDRTITYKTSDSNVATVSSSGLVTAMGQGKATITAAIGTSGSTASYTVYVLKASLASDSKVYDSTAYTPDVTVTADTTVLNASTVGNSSITLTYDTTVNVGTKTVTVNGIGNYTGYEEELPYAITALDITGETAYSKLSNVAAAGKVKFSAAVTTENNTVNTADLNYHNVALAYGDDYTVRAVRKNTKTSDGKAYAVYDITITGQGNATGTHTITDYECEMGVDNRIPLSSVMSLKSKSVEFDPYIADQSNGMENAIKAAVTVCDASGTITNQFNSDIANGTISVSVDTFTNIGNYTVTYEASDGDANGEGANPLYYGSVTVTVKVTAFSLQKAESTGKLKINMEYNGILKEGVSAVDRDTWLTVPAEGSSILPEVTVLYDYDKDGTFETTIGTSNASGNYRVVGLNNTNAGMAAVTINGQGNYTKTINRYFTIIESFASADDITVNLTDGGNEYEGAYDTTKKEWVTDLQKTYTGESITPSVEVFSNGVELTENTDFKVFYGEPVPSDITTYNISAAEIAKISTTNAGTAYILIVGMGDYEQSGKVFVSFTIAKKNLSDAVVAITTNRTYNGQAQTLDFDNGDTITVTCGGNNLTRDVDYEISGYANNTNAGTATVTIAAVDNSNYTGTNNKGTFTIEKLPLASVTLAKKTAINKPFAQRNPVFLTPATQATYDARYSDNETTINADGIYDYYLMYNNQILEKDVDYVENYNNSHNTIGSVAVTLTAADNGNFSGAASGTVTFQIKPLELRYLRFFINYKEIPIDQEKREGNAPDFSYNGVAQYHIVDVAYDKNGDSDITLDEYLTRGTDYTLDYDNVINAKTDTKHSTIKIKGIEDGTYGFSGAESEAVTIHYNILKRDLAYYGAEGYLTASDLANAPNITISDKGLLGDDNNVRDPDQKLNQVKDTNGDGAITEADNGYANGDYYIIDSSDNFGEAGDHSVTIKGINNYDGTYEVKFTTGTDLSTAISNVNPTTGRVKVSMTGAAGYDLTDGFSVAYGKFDGFADKIVLTDTSTEPAATLVKDTDYTVTIKDRNGTEVTADNAGTLHKAGETYTVTIKGMGSEYYNEQTFRYTVTRSAAITSFTVTNTETMSKYSTSSDNGALMQYVYAGMDNDVPFNLKVTDENGSSPKIEKVTIDSGTTEYGASDMIPVSQMIEAAGTELAFITATHYFNVYITDDNYQGMPILNIPFKFVWIDLNGTLSPTFKVTQTGDDDKNNLVSIVWNNATFEYTGATAKYDEPKLTVTYGASADGGTKTERTVAMGTLSDKGYYVYAFHLQGVESGTNPIRVGTYYLTLSATSRDGYTEGTAGSYGADGPMYLTITEKQIGGFSVAMTKTSVDYTGNAIAAENPVVISYNNHAYTFDPTGAANGVRGTYGKAGVTTYVSGETYTMYDNDSGEAILTLKPTYTNNTDPGKANVSVAFSPAPNYAIEAGTEAAQTADFKIVGNLTNAAAHINVPNTLYIGTDGSVSTLYTDVTRTGYEFVNNTVGASTGTIGVTFNETPLKYGTEFTVTAVGNGTDKSALIPGSTITVTISGAGDCYTGTKTFDIPVKGFLNDAAITGVEEYYPYTGTNIAVNPVVKATYYSVTIGASSFNTGNQEIQLVKANDYTITTSPAEVKEVGSYNLSLAQFGDNYVLKNPAPSVNFSVKYDMANAAVTAEIYDSKTTVPDWTFANNETLTTRTLSYTTFNGINVSANINGTPIIFGTDYTLKYVNSSNTAVYDSSRAGDGGQENADEKILAGGANKQYEVVLVATETNTKNIKPGTEFRKNFKVGYGKLGKVKVNDVEVTGNASVRYTGKPVTEQRLLDENEIVVYDDAGVKLDPADYSFTFTTSSLKDVTTAGIYKVVGKGNYLGSELDNNTYSIIAKNMNDFPSHFVIDIPNLSYTGKEQSVKDRITVTDKESNQTLTPGVDYTVGEDYTGTEVSTYTVTITGSGKNYTGSLPKDWEITTLSFTDNNDVILEPDELLYTGQNYNVKDLVTVKLSSTGKDLDKNSYTVTPSEVKDKNDYDIVIAGKGNYVGSKQMQLSVVARDFTTDKDGNAGESNNVSGAVTATFKDGKTAYSYSADAPVKPVVIVTDTGLKYDNGTDRSATLSAGEDKDYTVTYMDSAGNVSADGVRLSGVSYAVIEGKNNYTGTYMLPFTVGEAITDNAFTVTVTDNTKEYTGSVQEPTIVVKKGQAVLTRGEDYTVTYRVGTKEYNPQNDGQPCDTDEYTVVVTGIGKYYDKNEENTFTITPKQTTVSVILEKDSYPYTGEIIKPAFKVHNAEGEELAESDYEAAYGSGTKNIDVHAAESGPFVKITKKEGGNYIFSQKVEYFEITPVDLEDSDVTVELNMASGNEKSDDTEYFAYDYTGTALKPLQSITVVTNEHRFDDVNKGYSVEYEYPEGGLGTATLTITGTGNFVGEIVRTFDIFCNLQGASAAIKAMPWTGNKIVPTDDEITYTNLKSPSIPKIANGDIDLTVDGSVDWTSGELAGKSVTTTITGINDDTHWYYNEIATSFKVTADVSGFYAAFVDLPDDVSGSSTPVKVTKSDGIFGYTGKPVVPAFAIMSGASVVADSSKTGYSIVYTATTTDGKKVTFDPSKDSAPDDAFSKIGTTVNVKLAYTLGTKPIAPSTLSGGETFTYKIGPKNLADSDVTISLSSIKIPYQGNDAMPTVTVSYDGKTLTPGTDYTITAENNSTPSRTVPSDSVLTEDKKAVVKITAGTNGSYYVKTEDGGDTIKKTYEIYMSDISDLKVVQSGKTGLTVSYGKAPYADGYEINVKKNGTSIGNNYPKTITGTSHTVASLTAGTGYSVEVRPFVTINGVSYYGHTTSGEAVTEAVSPAMTEPESTVSGQVELSWASGGYSGVEIYRATSKDGVYTRIADIPSKYHSFTDAMATSGKTYWYKTCAFTITADGRIVRTGTFSEPVSIKVK